MPPSEGTIVRAELYDYFEFIDCSELYPGDAHGFSRWEELYNWTFKQAMAMKQTPHQQRSSSRTIQRMMHWVLRQ